MSSRRKVFGVGGRMSVRLFWVSDRGPDTARYFGKALTVMPGFRSYWPGQPLRVDEYD